MAGLPVRRAPYKDFLQPALQRRFASTAIVLLAVSYAEALLLAQWNSLLWPWFPLGFAGIRTAFLFGCGISILILRISLYHVGLRTTGSGFSTLSANLTSFSTYETILWYHVSAWMFCFVFLWSSYGTELNWITYVSGDRAKLNERPVFLACYLTVFALRQSVDHFKDDVDRLDLKTLSQSGSKDGAESATASLKAMLGRLPQIFVRCFQKSAEVLFLTLIAYFALLRPMAWRWALMFLRLLYKLPAASILPHQWPTSISLLIRCLIAGTLVSFIWNAGNEAFSIFMVKEPLKNGQPLTSDSKDPNGSLLNGLKSKKLSVKCFAMWELSLIAQNYEPRRRAIFADIDRKDGPAWAQIYSVCMEVLRNIESRVDDYGKPVAPAVPPGNPTEEKPRTLPPLKNEPIFAMGKSGPATAGDRIKKAIDRPGDSPMSKLSPLAKKTWNHAKDRMLTKDQRDAVSPEKINGQFQKFSLTLMNFGWISALFRHEYRSEFAGVVLGQPHAEPSLFANSATSLCRLVVNSKKDDEYGNVHRDLPSIIRTLTSIIRKVEALKERFPVHWTDINGKKECLEVEQVLDAARTGLGEVIAEFEQYSHDLRLTQTDVRLAKEAAAKPKVLEDKSEVKEVIPSPAAAALPRELKAQPRERRVRQSQPEMEQVKYR